MSLRKLFLFFITLVFIFGFQFVGAYEQTEEEVKALMAVDAEVPSRVCPQYSSVSSNVAEVLSGSSQKVVLTVVILDCKENPMENLSVFVESNRGAIDKIRSVDADGGVIFSGDGQGVEGKTDANGYSFFEVYPNVPGEVTFTGWADNTKVSIGDVGVKFLPPPFPKSISVVVEVPKIISPSGLITVFNPGKQDITEDGLVNLTMELRLPAWIFYLFLVAVFGNTLLFLGLFLLMIRIKKLQKIEISCIEEEKRVLKAEAEDIKKIAENINNRQ